MDSRIWHDRDEMMWMEWSEGSDRVDKRTPDDLCRFSGPVALQWCINPPEIREQTGALGFVGPAWSCAAKLWSDAGRSLLNSPSSRSRNVNSRSAIERDTVRWTPGSPCASPGTCMPSAQDSGVISLSSKIRPFSCSSRIAVFQSPWDLFQAEVSKSLTSWASQATLSQIFDSPPPKEAPLVSLGPFQPQKPKPNADQRSSSTHVALSSTVT